MKSKLLNKNAYEAVCRNCKNGRLSPDGETVLCVKKGVVGPDGKCRRYSYDPLKRVPRKAPVLMTADPDEFDLNVDFEGQETNPFEGSADVYGSESVQPDEYADELDKTCDPTTDSASASPTFVPIRLKDINENK